MARTLWREHRLMFLAFAAALVVTVFFAARMVLSTVYWADPDHRDQPLEGWMTPRYVAHSYELPPSVVRDALKLEGDGRKRQTLAELEERSGLTLEQMQRRIAQAAEAYHGDQP